MLLSYRWVFEISVSRSRSESGPGSDSNKTVVLCKGAQVEPPDTKLCFCGLFKKKKKKSARHFPSLWPPLHLRPSLLLLFLHSIFCMQGHSTPHDALRQGREVSRAEQSRADPPIRRENRVEEAGTELVDGWVNSSVSVILATPSPGGGRGRQVSAQGRYPLTLLTLVHPLCGEKRTEETRSCLGVKKSRHELT